MSRVGDAGSASIRSSAGSLIQVDQCDAHLLVEYTWVHSAGASAVTAWNRGVGGNVALHQLIARAPQGFVVDHINGDVCDNRRSNLRICRQQENARNVAARKDKAVRYKGVARSKGRSRPYRAYIWLDGRQKHLGCFVTAEEAAASYDSEARRQFGAFACVNFPRESERSAIHDEARNG